MKCSSLVRFENIYQIAEKLIRPMEILIIYKKEHKMSCCKADMIKLAQKMFSQFEHFITLDFINFKTILCSKQQ